MRKPLFPIQQQARKTYNLQEQVFPDYDIPRLYQQAQQVAYRINLQRDNKAEHVSPGKLLAHHALRLAALDLFSYLDTAYPLPLETRLAERCGGSEKQKEVESALLSEYPLPIRNPLPVRLRNCFS